MGMYIWLRRTNWRDLIEWGKSVQQTTYGGYIIRGGSENGLDEQESLLMI